MAGFTRVDRNLLLRVGLHLAAAAKQEENAHGNNWGASAEAREAKKRFDRIRRDRGDLEAMRRRMEIEFPDSLTPAPAPVAPNGDGSHPPVE